MIYSLCSQGWYIGITAASQANDAFANKPFVFNGFAVFENRIFKIVTLNVTP